MQPLHERKVNEARIRLGGRGRAGAACHRQTVRNEGYRVGQAASLPRGGRSLAKGCGRSPGLGSAVRSPPRVLFAATLRSVDAKSRGGMARELAGRADGPVDQLAGAIGAKPAERSRAVHAERALEGADSRVGRVRRQIPIAALTAGSDLEHLRLLPQEHAPHRARAVAFSVFGDRFSTEDSIPAEDRSSSAKRRPESCRACHAFGFSRLSPVQRRRWAPPRNRRIGQCVSGSWRC